jgi:hypothetical protein
MQLYTYATLEQAKTEFDATNEANDAFTLGVLRQLTARFEAECNQVFAPVIKTRYYDARGDHSIDYGKKRLFLRYPLLEANAVTDGNDTALVADTDYRLYPRDTVAYALQGLSAYGGWHQYTGDWVEAISVAGIWGYHEDYANAWVASGDALAANVSDTTGTTLTVADVDAVNPLTGYARFSPGMLIRIDDEYMTVLSVDSDANTLTVQRGANGSTAATHDEEAAISVWQAMHQIQRVVARSAAFLVKRRSQFERVQFETASGVVTQEFPADLEKEWSVAVARLRRYESIGI